MLAPPLQDPEALMRTPRSNRKSKLKTAKPSQQPSTPNKSPSKRSAAAAVEDTIHDGQVSPSKQARTPLK